MKEENWATEYEMVGYCQVHEFDQTTGDSEGQGSLGCYNPWGRKELDMSE